MIAIAVDDEVLMLGALVAAIRASTDISEIAKFSSCAERREAPRQVAEQGGACVYERRALVLRREVYLSVALSFRHFLTKMPPPSRREAQR